MPTEQQMTQGGGDDFGVELEDIGFVEFTTDLIQGVFDTVLAANLEQTETYLKLLSTVSKDLTVYINETEGEVTNDELLSFIRAVPELGMALTGDKPDAEIPTEVNEGHLISDSPVKVPAVAAPALNAALGIAKATPAGVAANVLGGIAAKTAPAVFSSVTSEPTEAELAKMDRGKLLDAVAQKIASDKFSILQEMVKLGMMRTVIDSGTIETRLTFKVTKKDVSKTRTREKNRTRGKDKARAHGRLSESNEVYRRARGRDGRRGRSLSVSTAKTKDVKKSTEKTAVYGRVVINFSTDYVPVAQA